MTSHVAQATSVMPGINMTLGEQVALALVLFITFACMMSGAVISVTARERERTIGGGVVLGVGAMGLLAVVAVLVGMYADPARHTVRLASTENVVGQGDATKINNPRSASRIVVDIVQPRPMVSITTSE